VSELRGRSPSETGHGWFDVVSDNGGLKVRAICECGWTSPSAHAAGLAGAAWDVHVIEVVDGPDRAVIAEMEASLDRGDIAPDPDERSRTDQ
jgi:hypothetical protein